MIMVYQGWIGYGRNCFLNICKTATVIVFITSVITTQIAGLDSYKFRLGTKAVIPFSFPLEEHLEYCWEMFRFGVSHPFNNNGTMQPNALNPSQRNRFQINCTWGTDILDVKLIIQNISEIDSGVYRWAIQQHAPRTKRLVSSFDARVDVIRPPGKVECRIEISPYDKSYREVHCNATVGSDGGGQLICYQKNVKTTFQKPPVISLTHVDAIFWMEQGSSINCCSHEANYQKVSADCNEFKRPAFYIKKIFEDQSETTTTSKPIFSTPMNKIETGITRLKSATTTEQVTTKQETTSRTGNSDDIKCNCQTFKNVHYYYAPFIGVLFIALVMSLGFNIKHAGFNTKTDPTRSSEQKPTEGNTSQVGKDTDV